MNLFVTDPGPAVCAAALDDKRVVNQLRETAQMLCTALHQWGCTHPALMREAHKHHPVTKWVGASVGNFAWTLDHFWALAEEKLRRWPNNPQHKNFTELSPLLGALALEHSEGIPGARMAFQNSARNQTLGLDFSSVRDVPEAYRLYMAERWKTDARPPRWTNTTPPAWAFSKELAA